MMGIPVFITERKQSSEEILRMIFIPWRFAVDRKCPVRLNDPVHLMPTHWSFPGCAETTLLPFRQKIWIIDQEAVPSNHHDKILFLYMRL
jgi:hypothetical protein